MLIAVNDYRLNLDAGLYLQAARDLATRVAQEGERGVISYRFFADAAGGQGRAVIRYTGPEAWMGHHHLSFGWPEMQALHRAATLERITLLGEVSAEIRAWIENAGMAGKVTYFPQGAGFDR